MSPGEIYFREMDYVKQFIWYSFGSEDVKL